MIVHCAIYTKKGWFNYFNQYQLIDMYIFLDEPLQVMFGQTELLQLIFLGARTSTYTSKWCRRRQVFLTLDHSCFFLLHRVHTIYRYYQKEEEGDNSHKRSKRSIIIFCSSYETYTLYNLTSKNWIVKQLRLSILYVGRYERFLRSNMYDDMTRRLRARFN